MANKHFNEFYVPGETCPNCGSTHTTVEHSRSVLGLDPVTKTTKRFQVCANKCHKCNHKFETKYNV